MLAHLLYLSRCPPRRKRSRVKLLPASAATSSITAQRLAHPSGAFRKGNNKRTCQVSNLCWTSSREAVKNLNKSWTDPLHLLETRLIENVFTLTPALTLTLSLTLTLTLTLPLKRNNVFGLTKWRHFSIKCTDTELNNHVITQFSKSALTAKT